MSQKLGSLLPLSHNVTLRRPPPSPLTCNVIYGCPLSRLSPLAIFSFSIYLHYSKGIIQPFYFWSSALSSLNEFPIYNFLYITAILKYVLPVLWYIICVFAVPVSRGIRLNPAQEGP